MRGATRCYHALLSTPERLVLQQSCALLGPQDVCCVRLVFMLPIVHSAAHVLRLYRVVCCLLSSHRCGLCHLQFPRAAASRGCMQRTVSDVSV